MAALCGDWIWLLLAASRCAISVGGASFLVLRCAIRSDHLGKGTTAIGSVGRLVAGTVDWAM